MLHVIVYVSDLGLIVQAGSSSAIYMISKDLTALGRPQYKSWGEVRAQIKNIIPLLA